MIPPRSAELPSPKPALGRQEALQLARRFFGLEGQVSPLVSYCDQNYRLDGDEGTWVLKIANANERMEWLDLQNRAMDRLADARPWFGSPRACPSVNGRTVESVSGVAGQRHGVRLVTWVDGVPWDEGPVAEPTQCRQLGRLVGEVVEVLAGFEHPAMDRYQAWDPLRLPDARPKLDAVADPHRRDLARRCLDRFESRVLPRLSGLPTQVAHTDVNNTNVLVEGACGSARVVGVIDFGDAVRTVRIAELGIAVAYAMLGRTDPLAVADEVVAGYLEVSELLPEERDMLLEIVVARLVMSVTTSASQLRIDPANTYLSLCAEPAWALLERLGRPSAPNLGHGHELPTPGIGSR